MVSVFLPPSLPEAVLTNALNVRVQIERLVKGRSSGQLSVGVRGGGGGGGGCEGGGGAARGEGNSL